MNLGGIIFFHLVASEELSFSIYLPNSLPSLLSIVSSVMPLAISLIEADLAASELDCKALMKLFTYLLWISKLEMGSSNQILTNWGRFSRSIFNFY